MRSARRQRASDETVKRSDSAPSRGGRTTCTCAWTSAWSNVCCHGALLTVTLMSSWLRKPADWARRTPPALYLNGAPGLGARTTSFHLYSSFTDSDLSVQPCCSGNVRLKSFKASNINANRWWGLIASADGDVAARNAVLQLLKKITQRRWAATVNRKCASVTQSWMSRWCSRARLPSYLLLFRPQGCECTFIFLLRWFIFNTTVWWLMVFIRVQTPKWHFLT